MTDPLIVDVVAVEDIAMVIDMTPPTPSSIVVEIDDQVGGTGPQGVPGPEGPQGPMGPMGGPPSAVAPKPVAPAGVVGVATPYSREDHVHATAPTYNLTGAAGADLFSAQVTADTNPRWVANGNGMVEWGPGNVAPDTYIYRSNPAELASNAALVLKGPIYMDGNADVNLYRSAAGVLKTDSNFVMAGTYMLLGAAGYVDTTSKLNVGGSTHTLNGMAANLHTYRDLLADFKPGNTTGTLKITLPKGFVSEWISLCIRGYDYATGMEWEVSIGGFLYAGTGDWINHSAYILGRPPFGSNIRLGYDGAKAVVLLGTTATTWLNTNYHVNEARSNGTGWGFNWTGAYITDESALTKVVAPVITVVPLPATVVSPPVATAGAVGVATTYARQDHVHSGLQAIFTGHPVANLINPNNTQIPTNTVFVNSGSYVFVYDVNGVTIPRNGVWQVRLKAMASHTAAAQCQIWVKNQAGTTLAYASRLMGSPGNESIDTQASAIALTAGDVIKCYATYPGTIWWNDGSAAVLTELTLVLLLAT